MTERPLDRRASRSTPAPSWLARIGDRLAALTAAVGFQRWARVVAVALVPLLLPDGTFEQLWLPFVLLAVYAAAAAFVGRDLLPRYGDVLAATGLLLFLGADALPFLPFLLVATAGPAVRGGLRAGLAAGGWLGLVLIVRLVVTGDAAALELQQVLPLVVLLPLVGSTVAAAAELLQDRSVRERLVLQQANRLLSSLRAIADDLPSGLDATSVATALVAEARDISGLHAVIAYVDVDGVLQPAATAGVEQSSLPPLRIDDARRVVQRPGRLLTPSSLPRPLGAETRVCRHWLAFPLGAAEAPTGLLLAGTSDADSARAARQRMASLAADGSLALENARLFDGTRARAADAARKRVAGDLHDGVAQSLAHLRLELELLARERSDGELGRLSRVAGTALVDLRSTIHDLRTAAEGDLASRLTRHVDELRSPRGPDLTLRLDAIPPLSADRVDEAMRIAQEAISNALRHAQASTITVLLAEVDGDIELRVADDGVGPDAPTHQAGGGVGLRSMQERAERLGGSIEVAPGASGGTVVAVAFPPTDRTTATGRTR
jgi:signal transduction histidine kinase